MLNGNIKRPKVEALHQIIKWYNLNYNSKLKALGLDLSPIQNNNWLSGYIDADGSFYLNWLYDKKNLPTSLQYYMRLSQKQSYDKNNSILYNY